MNEMVKYGIDTEVMLNTPEGVVRGYIVSTPDADGLIQVMTDTPVNGNRVNVFTKEQLDVLTGAKQLEEDSAAAVKRQGVEQQEEVLYCENCGRKIPIGYDRCVVCEYPVPENKRHLIKKEVVEAIDRHLGEEEKKELNPVLGAVLILWCLSGVVKIFVEVVKMMSYGDFYAGYLFNILPIVAVILILAKKKWGVYLWVVSAVIGAILNLSVGIEPLMAILSPLLRMLVVLVLLLVVKRKGVPAWKVLE